MFLFRCNRKLFRQPLHNLKSTVSPYLFMLSRLRQNFWHSKRNIVLRNLGLFMASEERKNWPKSCSGMDFIFPSEKNTKKKPCLPCRPKSYWWKAMKKISISEPSIPKSLPYAARLWKASSKPSTKMLTVSFLTAKNWLFRESVVLLLQLLNKYVKLRISFDEFCR